MKSLLTICISLVIITTGLAQTVRRVNNNVGISGTNVYATFALAHTAAANNDIIIVEPSSTSYGDITITKPLKIYGNGYYLTINTELKADQRSSTFGSIDFNTGSGGSEIYGVATTYIYIYGVSNLVLSRNNVSSFNYLTSNKAGTTNTNVTNILISRNYIGNLTPSTVAGTVSNFLITNNIIGYITANNDPIIQNWVVRNNTFIGNAGSTTLVNSVLENNFFPAGGSSPGLTNVTISYNVSTAANFSSGIGNVNNYVLAPINDSGVAVSELLGTGSGISLDEAYIVKAGSGLKTLGNGSTEVGAYGGSTPYIVSGIPPIPSIVNMISSGTGDTTNPLKVTLTVKSNN